MADNIVKSLVGLLIVAGSVWLGLQSQNYREDPAIAEACITGGVFIGLHGLALFLYCGRKALVPHPRASATVRAGCPCCHRALRVVQSGGRGSDEAFNVHCRGCGYRERIDRKSDEFASYQASITTSQFRKGQIIYAIVVLGLIGRFAYYYLYLEPKAPRDNPREQQRRAVVPAPQPAPQSARPTRQATTETFAEQRRRLSEKDPSKLTPLERARLEYLEKSKGNEELLERLFGEAGR